MHTFLGLMIYHLDVGFVEGDLRATLWIKSYRGWLQCVD